MSSTLTLSKTFWVYILLGIIVYAFSIVINTTIPFSFDHVYLVSYVADHIFHSDFSSFIVDQQVDTGHPPLAAFVHALGWKIFGKTLVVSHWIMLLFISASYYFFLAISRNWVADKQLYIPAIIFLVFPVSLAQIIYMSSDIMLLAFFLGAVYFLLRNKRILYLIMMALCLLTSLRGIPLIAAFFVTELILCKRMHYKEIVQQIFFYALAIIPFILWNVYHWNATGWMLFNADSIWAGHRNWNSFEIFLIQIAAFGLRLFEFGGIWIWIIVFLHRKHFVIEEKSKLILYLVLSTIAFLALTTLPFSNPVSIRYLLPVFLLGMLLFSIYISSLQQKFRMYLLSVYIIICIAFTFFIYPERATKAIGYSWDCSIVSLPYFNTCENDAQLYLQSNPIQQSDSIYAGMPFFQSDKYTFLMEKNNNPSKRWERPDMPYGNYFVYSNMMNDITWEQKQWLESHWILDADFSAGKMYIQIFRNPQQEP